VSDSEADRGVPPSLCSAGLRRFGRAGAGWSGRWGRPPPAGPRGPITRRDGEHGGEGRVVAVHAKESAGQHAV